MSIIIYVFLVNVLTFLLYAIDIHRQTYSLSGIPNAILLLFTIIGGAFGALSGMLFFSHKTNDTKFVVCGVVALFVLCLVLALLAYFLHLLPVIYFG